MKPELPIMLAIIMSIALIMVGCGGVATIPQIGDNAPDFTLKNIDGESVSLSDFRGKPVLLVFTSVYCVECTEQMPYIEAAFEQSDGKLVVLTVYREDSLSRVKKHVDEEKLTTFPALPDPDDKVGIKYGLAPRVAPVNIFIDADGIIRNVSPGSFQSQDEIESILNSL